MYIDGIGDEVTNFFLLLLIVSIVFAAWKSTIVRETSLGVLILENRQLPVVQRSDSQLSNRTETEEIDVVNSVIEELENDISNFVSGETSAQGSEEQGGEERAEERIIQRMDHPDGETNEIEVKEEGRLRHRRQGGDAESGGGGDEGKDMTIKLKYLNDEVRMVKAKTTEPIGDFKKRNFTVELAGQKLVRLVFNGQVLQQDNKTLSDCGLFDNCVMHVLIHNKKPSGSQTQDSIQASAGETSEQATAEGLQQQETRAVEYGRWYLYVGLTFLMFVLIASWFARFQYANYFSFYATVGLILCSVLFAGMIPLLIIIDRSEVA